MRSYILSSGGLRRGQRLHRWLLEEKTWVSIFWKLTSIQCSFVTLVSFRSHCNLLKARQQARWTLIDWIFSVALFIQCPMQVVRTKLFDIIADPRENEYEARRKALTFVDKWGDWSQDWRSFDADLSLSGKTKRVKRIFCLSFVFLGGIRGCRRPLTRFQGQMLTIHGKVDGDSKARDWRIRGWLWRLWTNCRQDSRRRILTHRQSVRLCPSALCLCALYNLCNDCGHFSQTYFYTVMFKSQQTLYVFKVDRSSQKLLRHETVDLDSSPMESEKFVLDGNILWMAFIWMQCVQFSHKWYVGT